MIIKSIELADYRNYDSLVLQFDRGTNILYGDNAQGKTNILEAIYVAATTKSHKGSKDREIVNFDKEEAHIRTYLEKDGKEIRVDMHLRKSKSKGIAIDGQKIKKAADLLGLCNVVFFSPEDLGIIKNGPAERRRFVDMELCQLDNFYLYNLNHYNKIISDLQAGRLEDEMIEIEVAETATGNDTMLAMGIDLNLNEMFGGVLPKKTKARKVTVRDARRILSNEESEKLVDMDAVVRDAIDKAEQDGIVFIDEIDKIAAKGAGSGPDVSREGVQRDILPIVEGSVVSTKYGPVRTNYMLFISAGAFHVSKINDLIPELQGRFPIVVKLNALTTDDYERILTAPQNAITKQYAALLETDNIRIEFKQEALRAVAEAAFHANSRSRIANRQTFPVGSDPIAVRNAYARRRSVPSKTTPRRHRAPPLRS